MFKMSPKAQDDVLFSPQPKDIQCTATEEERNQEVFRFEKLGEFFTRKEMNWPNSLFIKYLERNWLIIAGLIYVMLQHIS